MGGSITENIHSVGHDNTDLGRWVWQLFKGWDGIATRCYTAYCPVKAHSLSTTYMQHWRYFRSHGRSLLEQEVCPRDAFLRDLSLELHSQITAGERLIVMMDGNCDMRGGPLWQMMTDMGLRDAILARHGTTGAPATYILGQHPIDAIWVSLDIPVVSAGWLGGDFAIGDHRVGFVDIPFQALIGEEKLKVAHPQARRLNCGLPKA